MALTYRLNKGKHIADTSKPQPIYLRYNLGRKVDFNASIGVSVLPNDWDTAKQRISNKSNLANRNATNDLLTKIENHFNDFTNENTRKGILPTYESVKSHLKAFYTTPVVEVKQPNLFTFIEQFIERAKTEIHPTTKKRLANGTIKGYLLTYNILKKYNKEVRKINFKNLNLDFYLDFVDYCQNQNLTANYIGKHVKTIKTFLRSAIEQGITTNNDFLSKRAVVMAESSDNIYLNDTELRQMFDLDLTDYPRHYHARDLFLIGAYTGLRVSDYNNITEQNIKTIQGVKMLTITTKKTAKDVAIPLHPIVEHILSKYKGNLPKMPEQKLNQNIKDVAEWCGIDSTEHITQTRGGKRITKKVQKFELVKSHTARRSFCTNAYLMDMPTLDIMAISGHTSEKTFLNYIKVTPEQRAIKMSSHPYFTSKLKVV